MRNFYRVAFLTLAQRSYKGRSERVGWRPSWRILHATSNLPDFRGFLQLRFQAHFMPGPFSQSSNLRLLVGLMVDRHFGQDLSLSRVLLVMWVSAAYWCQQNHVFPVSFRHPSHSRLSAPKDLNVFPHDNSTSLAFLFVRPRSRHGCFCFERVGSIMVSDPDPVQNLYDALYFDSFAPLTPPDKYYIAP